MSARDPWAAFRAAPDWIWRAIIFLLALAVLLLITTRWRIWETNATRQSTDDAYLQSDLTPIAAHVAGYIREMPVQDYRTRPQRSVASRSSSMMTIGPRSPN